MTDLAPHREMMVDGTAFLLVIEILETAQFRTEEMQLFLTEIGDLNSEVKMGTLVVIGFQMTEILEMTTLIAPDLQWMIREIEVLVALTGEQVVTIRGTRQAY